MANDLIVDFKDYGLNIADTSCVSQATIKVLGDRIINVLKTNGFCYLKNHGVAENLVKEYMEVSRDFFESPEEVKGAYPMGADYAFGWVKLEREKPNKDRSVGDLHEAFNYRPTFDDAWPPVDKFEALTKKLFEQGKELAFRFCDVLSLGLDLPIDFMRNAHKNTGQRENSSQTRTVYYPSIKPETVKASDQVRLGEHCDWGTIAFNFQDNIGGLEVRNPKGMFVPADPIPGTIVVTISAMLQRWTADMLKGSIHRILVPVEERRRNAVRQAIVFFLQPDDDFVVECLDGSNKYEPIRTRNYFDYRAEVSLDY